MDTKVTKENLQEFAQKFHEKNKSLYFKEEDVPEVVPPIVSEWLAENIDPDGAAGVVDKTLSIEGTAADAKAAGDQIRNVKSAFNFRVPEGYNLIDTVIDDTFINNTTGEPNTNSNYKATDFIPLAGDKFVLGSGIGNAAIGFYGAWYDKDKTFISAVTLGDRTVDQYYGANYAFWTVSVPVNAKYIRLSFSNVFWTVGPVMYDGDVIRTLHQPYNAGNILIAEKQDSRFGPALNEAVGGFYTNSYKSMPLIHTTPYVMGVQNSSHGGEILTFFGEFSNFNGAVELSFKDDAYVFGLDSDEYYFKTEGAESRYPHNLTIANYLAISMQLADNGYSCVIDISTNGGNKRVTNSTFISRKIGQPTIKAISPQSFTFTFASWLPKTAKPIWLFGDSYLSAWSAARWPYYLYQNNQADNIMLDGYPGEDAEHSIISFENLLKLGTPRFAIWAIGMNDGDDTDINTDWETATDHFIELCEEKNIIPVLATIPNVPSVLHTYKNTYIRNSGYRYIDFAKALNADTAGATWYSGMLAPAPDLVHPTEEGARCMYHAFITAFPEILFK